MKVIRAAGINQEFYYILTEKGGLNLFIDLICARFSNRKIIVVSDDFVFPIYKERIDSQFSANNVTPYYYIFPHGEQSKTIETACKIVSFLSDINADRGSVIVSFGGGVTGDLCGFVSSVYKRGIKYLSIPTTLISMSDSSVGMKNGVDFNGIKNVIGTFYAPESVYIDPELAKTLPVNVLCDGFGEIVKYAWLRGGDLYDTVYSLSGPADLTDKLSDILSDAVAYKDSLVKSDPSDRKERHLLNLGHTLGHAIEGVSEGSVSHGYAVSAGILFSLYVGCIKKQAGFNEIEKTVNLFEKFRIVPYYSYDSHDLLEFIKNDKKITDGKIDFVTAYEPGHTVCEKTDCGLLIGMYEQYLKFMRSEFYGRKQI